MATIVKRQGSKGTTWQVKIRKHGKSETASFPTKALATDWAKIHEYEAVIAEHFPDQVKPSYHSVNDLIDVYIERVVNHHPAGTKRTYLHCLDYWRRALGDSNLATLTPAILSDCMYYLLNTKGLDPQTVNKYRDCFSPAMTLAASPALGWIVKNPFIGVRKLKIKPGRAPILTNQQVQSLLDECDRSNNPQLGLFCRVLLATGARKTEAMTLKWGQVNFNRRTISFLQTKGRKPRTVPIPQGLVDILQDIYHERFGEDAGLMNDPTGCYVFPSPYNASKPITNIFTSWNKARTRAGLAAFRLHDSRHHYSSRMIIDGGADILAVSTLLGHSSVRQSQRYAHLTQSHLTDQVEKMGQSLPL